MSKLIVVYGATGAQGGSLVKALLESTDFKVRAVTRDASADKAKALAALDDRVEIVESNLVGGDASKVLKGAYGLYLLTNFWDPSQMNKGKSKVEIKFKLIAEFEVGKPVVDAAKNAGVEHIIYSSLANVEEQSGGKYHVPHFTDKAKLSVLNRFSGLFSNLIWKDYIKKQNFKYFTEFYAAFYYQNFLHFFPPKEEDGVLTFTLPETSQMTAFDVNDTGKLVAPAFKDPETFNNKIIHASGYDGAPQRTAHIHFD